MTISDNHDLNLAISFFNQTKIQLYHPKFIDQFRSKHDQIY